MTPVELLTVLLQDELDHRPSRQINKRYKASQLDEKTALADMDGSVNPQVPRTVC